VSKERARRRQAREAEAAVARERAERRRLVEVERQRARTRRRRSLRALLGVTPNRVDSATRRAAARRWAPVLALLLMAHAVVWLLSDDPWVRLAAVGVTALAAPVVWVLVTDSSRRRRTGYRRRP
jgi:Flp pilus assembly protein TadB